MYRFFFVICSLFIAVCFFHVNISQGQENNQFREPVKLENPKIVEDKHSSIERKNSTDNQGRVKSDESKDSFQHALSIVFDKISRIVKILNKYASLISAFGALFAALVALYLGDWKNMLKRPKLQLSFNGNFALS